MKARVFATLIGAGAALHAALAQGQHVTDMLVGQSGGIVALSPAGLIPGTVYNPLLRVDTFLHGWSNSNPGFDHALSSQGGVKRRPGADGHTTTRCIFRRRGTKQATMRL